jgi:conjugative relaxase-like TrwC/TraI family protein
MLSMAKVARGRQGYYLATVAAGREHDGGLVERDGLWLGAGATAQGLTGRVDPSDLDAVLAGRNPATGELISASHVRVTVAGIDCTFSAPKSVSLLHALGPTDAMSETELAHDAAVSHTLTFLEDEAGRTRRRSGTTVQSVAVDGLTAAGFLHRTSRAPDPHLHTHVIVANCGRGADGRWSALDCRALYANCGTASGLYEAHLRHELGERLGIRFLAREGHGYDIENFDATLLAAFSRRSAEIEQHLADHGFSGPRARRIAALATRPPKDLSVAYDELVHGWRERSISLGVPVGHIGRVVEQGRERLRTSRQPLGNADPGLRDRAELERLTAVRASFSRADLTKALCRSVPEGASVGEMGQRVEALLHAGTVVKRESVPRLLQAHDGHWFPAGMERERFTTSEVLAIEERIANLARETASTGLAVANTNAVAAALEARPSLDLSARESVTALTQSGHGIEVVAADSRPGWETTLQRYEILDAAREAWASSGTAVIGIAPDRRAAERLESATGIETQAASLIWRASPDMAFIPKGAVVVVSGADRLGPRRVAGVCEMASDQGSKVVLLPDAELSRPDSRSLALIEAAGLTVRVQEGSTRSWDENASEVRWLEADGVTVGLARSSADARAAARELYESQRSSGRNVLMVCGDRAIGHQLGVEVVAPRDLATTLEARKPASLVVIGEATSLPAAVRRRATLERTHVTVDRGHDSLSRAERALEVALPPRTVRSLGTPRRTIPERSNWRTRARELLERGPNALDLGRPALQIDRGRGGLSR